MMSSKRFLTLRGMSSMKLKNYNDGSWGRESLNPFRAGMNRTPLQSKYLSRKTVVEIGMILTFKIKHDRDFSEELRKARQIADFAIKTRTFSSKDVKHIGLKSVIANQILRKYGRNKIIKRVKSIKLIIPNQGIKVDREIQTISIQSLKFSFKYLSTANVHRIQIQAARNTCGLYRTCIYFKIM
ncbi:hypothetical protein METP3_00205 [Methanosarcinales archaeon]|nr:hypothetical protein METP3_00205 [Methanosarcinales archaeon]